MLQARQSARESTSGALLLGAEPVLFPIDSNGNLTAKTEGSDNWVYTWNAENQLTKVEKNSVEQARFSYDPMGRRVEKVAGGVTISYTYDSEDILREVRGAATLKYVHGLALDDPLAVEDTAGLAYYHADGLGSIVKATNASGAVTLTRRYDAWGNLEISGTTPGYAFTGREWDPESGHYYYRMRYYDPQAGRFLSEDPLFLMLGLSRYPYVDNRPATFIDPMGLQGTKTGMPPTNMSCGQAYDVFFQLGWLVMSRAISDKLGHCLAHCYLQKYCSDNPVTMWDSWFWDVGKEGADEVIGVAAKTVYYGSAGVVDPTRISRFFNPDSKWDSGDRAYNEWGRSCPANESCWDRCSFAQSH